MLYSICQQIWKTQQWPQEMKMSVFILTPKKCNAKECPNYPRNCTHFTCKQSESESCSVVSDSLRPQGLFSPWNSPSQKTRVGSFSLLQVIFSSQGMNPGFPHYRWTLYQLRHKGSQRKLEWVAYPYSSRSSWPRNWTGVSFIAGIFFTN